MNQQELERHYAAELERLRAELVPKLPSSRHQGPLDPFLLSNALDASLTKFVVLWESTPQGLAAFLKDNQDEQTMFEDYLTQTDLLKELLVADGARAPRNKSKYAAQPAQWPRALQILTEIQTESDHACQPSETSVLRRLALAIALEHAVPIRQDNPKAAAGNAEEFVDPVRRYLNYEMAYLDGELDPSFDTLSVWELRFVVDGEEPDETAAWGRSMLPNFRPDHVLTKNEEWRYSMLARSDVRYGSQDVKYDRPELQQYQNILMNGGVCGRRAFIGRFILRAFGIPTTARPSKGHGALCHWTPSHGWVVNLGGGWGCGWTKTRYHKDVDFLATTRARNHLEAFCKVKRAQWMGDVVGERRIYGVNDDNAAQHLGFWNGVALKEQQAIIRDLIDKLPKNAKVKPFHKEKQKVVTRKEKVLDSPTPPDAKKINYTGTNIWIPAAAYNNPRATKDVHVMTCFRGGLQVYLPMFTPQGLTVLRGGTWKSDANQCCSGFRLLSGGYGKYEDWGFRMALGRYEDNGNTCPSPQMTLDLGANGATMELVYIRPGTFVMGGESTTDGRFNCVEVPQHKVQLTKGFYLGKYPVTQAQYQAVMGSNPSKSTKAPDCPVDNIGEQDALDFCTKLVDTIGKDVRLPTEAEWEYASRAGRSSKWFFGDDPSALGEYAWFKGNAGGKSHPVGQKKPNPFGLYDVYGNVWERIADKYAKDYYATGPPVDPTGPVQGTKSSFEFTVRAPQAGNYSLTAETVTANYKQSLNVVANDDAAETVIELPFTLGQWQETAPVQLFLKHGDNKLRFWRDNPPQYGVAIRGFLLKPDGAVCFA